MGLFLIVAFGIYLMRQDGWKLCAGHFPAGEVSRIAPYSTSSSYHSLVI